MGIASTAAADTCDETSETTLGVVLGFDLGSKTSVIGGVEVRRCMSDKDEGFVRIEGGGGRTRMIVGARTRPMEEMDVDAARELVGLEAGLAFDTKADLGAHLALTYGQNHAYLAFQTLFPFTNTQQRHVRTSLLGSVAPLSFIGSESKVVEGRPLTVDGRVWNAGIASLPFVRSREDQAVRDHFAMSARFEYSSVWTFLRLAAELAAVGAPPALIARALDAAEDEVRHAQMCANAAFGVELAALPMELARARFAARSPRALAILAREAWHEGCLNEGAAAEEARLAAGEAQGPIGEMLATIARDEAGHAALAWSVLEWVLEVAPEVVALEMPRESRTCEVSDRALAKRGVPSAEVKRAAIAHARTTAFSRLRAIS